MATFGFLRRIARDRVIVAVLLLLALAAGWFLVSNRPERASRLRLSAGSAQGLRHAMAETLAAEAAEKRVILSLPPTAGSEMALDRVDSGLIDLALVQGGLTPLGRKNIREVAALHIEPLHLVVKQEIAAAVEASLDALRDRSVNLGEVGSGTRTLAIEVLRFAGLEAGKSFRPSTLTYEQMEAETVRDRLPDAVFTVSLLPSPIVQSLVTRHDYRLVPLPFGEAFAIGGNSRRDATRARPEDRDLVRRDQV